MRVDIGDHYLNVEISGRGKEAVVLQPSVSRPASDLKKLAEDLAAVGYLTAIIISFDNDIIIDTIEPWQKLMT